MVSINENNFTCSTYFGNEQRILATLQFALSIILVLGGIFLLLAYYQALPQGGNCISNLGTAGLVIGLALSGLGLAYLIFIIKKKCDILSHSSQPEAENFQETQSQKDGEASHSESRHAYAEDWPAGSANFNSDLKGYTSSLSPSDNQLGDLLLHCKNSQVTCLRETAASGNQHPLPIEEIKIEFAKGKKMVFAFIGTETHIVAIGLSADGRFKIIDSMFSNSVNCREVTKALNQAGICDSNGKRIQFSGEYINTHIQKGGNDCIRFATLYCYHMAMRQNLDAYQEVNGAFLDGRLHRFEDYEKIPGSPKIASLAGKKYAYESFMRSWRYRMLGWSVDSWQEFSLQEIFAKHFPSESITCIALLDNTTALPWFLYPQKVQLFIQTGAKKHLIEPDALDHLLEKVHVDQHLPVRELLNREKSQYLLLYKAGSKSYEVFRLKEDQKFCY